MITSCDEGLSRPIILKLERRKQMINATKKYLFLWIFINLMLLISTCATKTNEATKKTTGKIQLITIDADRNANMGSPVAVDIVSAYDDQLVRTLESTTASDWFTLKKTYIEQSESNIFVIGREIAPGNQIQLEYTTEVDEKPVATFIFASYDSPGEHRVKMEKFKPLIIKLEESEFVVSE